jgi:hypothetical protein
MKHLEFLLLRRQFPGGGAYIDSACQSFIGKVQEALERWSVVVGIFFDLTKAYDVIDHDILLEI